MNFKSRVHGAVFAPITVIVGLLAGCEQTESTPQLATSNANVRESETSSSASDSFGEDTWQAVMSSILEVNPRGPRQGGGSGGSRGDDICVLNLDFEGEIEIWNLTPTLIMAGDVAGIALRPDGADEFSWRLELSSSENAIPSPVPIIYDGEPLQPGDEYKWFIFSPTPQGVSFDGRPDYIFSFTFIGADERESITSNLRQLETDLEAEGAETEVIALARASYFIENGLTADAVQEIFTTDQPSDELLETRSNLVSELCQSN